MKLYKLEVPIDPSLPCPILSLEMQNMLGYGSVIMSAGVLPSEAAHVWYLPYNGRSTITVCPFSPVFSYGTYYISVVNLRSSLYNEYMIRYRLTPSDTCPIPRPATPSFTDVLVGDALYVQLVPQETRYYQLYVPPSNATSKNGSEPCQSVVLSTYATDLVGTCSLLASASTQFPDTTAPDVSRSSSEHDQRLIFRVCPSNGTYIYFALSNFGLINDANCMFTSTTNIKYLVDVSTLPYQQPAWALSYGQAPALECDTQYFSCLAAASPQCNETNSGCCYLFFPIQPTNDPPAIIPWNGWDTTLPFTNLVAWTDFEVSKPGKLSWALYLGYSSPDGSGYNYVQADVSTCILRTSPFLTDATGVPIQNSISFVPDAIACDLALYSYLTAYIQSTIGSMYFLTDFGLLAWEHLRINLIAISSYIYACNPAISDLVVSSTISQSYPTLSTCNRAPGTAGWGADPCCNATLAESTCCFSNSFHSVMTTLPTGLNTAAVNRSCGSVSCAANTLSLYINSVKTVQDPVSGCSAQYLASASESVWKGYAAPADTCRDSLLGTELDGSACLNDSDCQYGKSCNIYTLRCDHTWDDVAYCIATSLSPAVLRTLYDLHGLTGQSIATNTTLTLFNETFSSYHCVGSGSKSFISSYHYELLQRNCNDSCNTSVVCFNTECDIPPECDSTLSTACPRYMVQFPADDAGCLEYAECNWMHCPPGSAPSDCKAECLNSTLSNETCVNCAASGSACVEVPGFNQSRCALGLCNLGPGYIGSDCTSSGICSTCTTCTDQTACESTGSCTDALYLTSYIGNYGYGGLCLLELQYELGQTYCLNGLIHVPSGCINTSIADEAECQSFPGAYWATLATNQTSCAAHGYSCYNANGHPIPGDLGVCTACYGATWRPYYNWSTGIWTAGKNQALQWVQRSWINPLSVEYTLDPTLIASALLAASASTISYSFASEALCRYSTSYTASNALLCDCDNGAPNPAASSTCYSSLNNQQVASSRICPTIAGVVTSRVANIEFASSNFPLSSSCQIVAIFTTSASYFQLDSTHRISSAVFQPLPPNSFWIVKRSGDSTNVGQIVSGAINVTVTSANTTQPALLCIFLESGIAQASEATVWSLGSWNGDYVVAFPPSPTVTFTGDSVCDYVTSPGTYFATKMEQDYQKAQSLGASNNRQLLAGVIIYFLLTTFAIVQAIVLIMDRAIERIIKLKLLFVAIAGVDGLVRGIYLALPNSALSNLPAIQFIIFELPTFLFLSVYLAIAFLWTNVVLKSSRWATRKQFLGDARVVSRNFFILGNIMLYGIFIVFVYLISILPNYQSGSACFLGASNNSLLNSVFYRVQLAYWITVATLSIVIVIGFLVGATLLTWTVLSVERSGVNRHAQGSAHKRRLYKLLLISVVAVVCTLFLVIRSILFLYASITGNSVDVILFVIFEVIPAAGLLYYLRPYGIIYLMKSTGSSSANQDSDSRGSAAGSLPPVTDPHNSGNVGLHDTFTSSRRSHDSESQHYPVMLSTT